LKKGLERLEPSYHNLWGLSATSPNIAGRAHVSKASTTFVWEIFSHPQCVFAPSAFSGVRPDRSVSFQSGPESGDGGLEALNHKIVRIPLKSDAIVIAGFDKDDGGLPAIQPGC
jgi:hypothetical protein